MQQNLLAFEFNEVIDLEIELHECRISLEEPLPMGNQVADMMFLPNVKQVTGTRR